MTPFAALPRAEQVQSLEMVMGALGLAFYPPATAIIQSHLRTLARVLPHDLQVRREELAALDAAAFAALFRETLNPLRTDVAPPGLCLPSARGDQGRTVDDLLSLFGLASHLHAVFGPMGGPIAAYGRARVDDRDPDPEHLHHFKTLGYAGHEALFMARYFNNLLEFMGEPERTELEASVLGPWSEAARRLIRMEDRSHEIRAEARRESRQAQDAVGAIGKSSVAREVPAFMRPLPGKAGEQEP